MSDSSNHKSVDSKSGILGSMKWIVIAVAAVVVVIVVAVYGTRYSENKRQSDFQQSYDNGMTAFKSGNIDDAVANLQKASELKPEDYQVRTNLAQGYSSKGKISEAQKQYEESIALNPKQPEALYNLGVIYKSEKQYDKAIETFTQAKALNKNLYPADIMLAFVYREKGQPDKSISILNQIIKAKPFGANMSDLYVELGLAYKVQNNVAAAKAQWTQALKLDPKNVKAKTLLASK